MSVAVILSTFNERPYVDRTLDALDRQTLPHDLVIVDGGSSDGTVERLRDRAAGNARIRVIGEGARRTLPDALNLALGFTSATLVAKVDARTVVAPDFLEAALTVLAREGDGVACVGGQPEQQGETRFGEGLALARTSRFGVGASEYASGEQRADVDTVQCGVYRRDALRAVGGFDAVLQFGEDEEVNWRLRRAGYRIVRDPQIRFRYVTRPSWRAAFRQYRNYGFARAQVWRKHPEFMRPYHLVPSLALVGAASLALSSPFSPFARRALAVSSAAYAVAAATAAVTASHGRARHIAPTMAAFSALHFGYGFGLLQGLCHTIPQQLVGRYRHIAGH